MHNDTQQQLVYNGCPVTDRITGCAASDTEHPHGLEYCPLSVFSLAITGSIAPHSTVHEACYSGNTTDSSKHTATTATAAAGTGTSIGAFADAATAGADGSSSAGEQQLQQNEQLNAAAAAAVEDLGNSAVDGATAVDDATVDANNSGVSSDMDAATAGVKQRGSTPGT
jgi:hypothetical protein